MRKKKYYAIAGGTLAAGALVIALLVTSGLESMGDIFALIFYGMATYLGVTEALMRLMDKPGRKHKHPQIYTLDPADYYRLEEDHGIPH